LKIGHSAFSSSSGALRLGSAYFNLAELIPAS
jgi:hypothetical protein